MITHNYEVNEVPAWKHHETPRRVVSFFRFTLYKLVNRSFLEMPHSNSRVFKLKQKGMSLLTGFLGRWGFARDPFSFDAWNPFEELGFNRYGEDIASANTKIDWKETKNAHVFIADLPGLKKEDVKVEVEGGTVVRISAERSKEEGDEKVKWHCRERSLGSFFRRFRLPEDAKADDMKAVMENGVLVLTVPKQEIKKSPKAKSVEISVVDKLKPKLKGCFRT